MTVKQKFEKYHSNNPHVYDMFVQYARDVKLSGLNRYSIWAVANRVRWHFDFEIQGDEEFKISNDYLCHYSRMIMDKEPDLKDFFRIKPLKADSFKPLTANG